MASKKEFEVTLKYQRILFCLSEFNNLKFYPNSALVSKMIRGIVDEETSNFSSFKTFASAPSLVSRKVTFTINTLIRNNYVKYVSFDFGVDEYLSLTEIGKEYLFINQEQFLHFTPKKKKPLKHPNFIRIID